MAFASYFRVSYFLLVIFLLENKDFRKELLSSATMSMRFWMNMKFDAKLRRLSYAFINLYTI